MQQRGHAVRQLVIEVPVRIFGPCIEVPVGEGKLAFSITDKNGAGVAGPDTIGGPGVKENLIQIRAGALEDTGREPLGLTVLDEDVHFLARGEQTNDLSVDPRDGLEFAGPVFAIVRPGEPCGLVRLPLGRHAVAEFAGG